MHFSDGGVLTKYEFAVVVIAIMLIISLCVRCFATWGKDDFPLPRDDFKISRLPEEGELGPESLRFLSEFRSLDRRLDEFEREIEQLEEMKAKAIKANSKQESKLDGALEEETNDKDSDEESSQQDFIPISKSNFAAPYLRFRKNMFS